MNDIKKHNLNIVTLGRSGVGKSSLLNYLLGKNCFRAGVGRPVTGAGFFEEKSIIADIPVTIIDSYGIESGANFKTWKNLFEKKLQEHDSSHSIHEWLHIVIYCISAEDARVEPIDEEIIRKMTSCHQKMIIAITHADRCEAEECKKLRDVVCEKCPNVKSEDFIEIDSVRKQQLWGNDFREMIIEQYLTNVFATLPEHCIRTALQCIDDFCRDLSKQIQERKYSIWDNDSSHAHWLEDKCHNFFNSYKEKYFPGIIHNATLQSVDIAKDIAGILQGGIAESDLQESFVYKFNTNVGDTVDLWEDDASFWEKFGKSIFATLLVVPAFVCVLICNDNKMKKELTDSLNNYCKDLKKQTEKSNEKLQKRFASLKKELLQNSILS